MSIHSTKRQVYFNRFGKMLIFVNSFLFLNFHLQIIKTTILSDKYSKLRFVKFSVKIIEHFDMTNFNKCLNQITNKLITAFYDWKLFFMV